MTAAVNIRRFYPIAILGVVAWGSIFPEPSSPPRLVVVVVIDQFRADYLYRFSEHYLPPWDGEQLGGIRLLMDEGAVYRNARHLHQDLARNTQASDGVGIECAHLRRGDERPTASRDHDG